MAIMWKGIWCLLLLAAFVADAEEMKHPMNLEDNIFFWESLFPMINTIVSETSRLSESQKTLTKTLLELIERQEKLETKLTEFMAESRKYYTSSEERQLSHTIASTAFIESTQNDLLIMKSGLQQQQNNISHLMNVTKYVEWTTVLRRQDGSVNFFRNWAEYQNGFGNDEGEFFIGLEKLHALTTEGPPQELMIVLKNFKNEKRIATYDLFQIGNAEQNYELLEVGKYSGDAGDSLTYHKNMKFSTDDNENDQDVERHCANIFQGAWWFRKCYTCHLFGEYKNNTGIGWNAMGGKNSAMKFAEMKIRSKLSKF